jgi:hypothetical protein
MEEFTEVFFNGEKKTFGSVRILVIVICAVIVFQIIVWRFFLIDETGAKVIALILQFMALLYVIAMTVWVERVVRQKVE